MNSTRPRVGLVGAGAISEFHARAVKRTDYAELLGVFDTSQDAAAALADRHGAKVFDSFESLLAAADAVHILTPPHTHADLTIQALEAGCHVYTEKPVATSADDANRILEVQAQTERQVCVGHSMLHDPQLKKLLDAAASGALGEILSATIYRGSQYPEYRGGPLPPHYREAGYPYRDLGVHFLYVFEALFGEIQHVDGHWSHRGGDRNLKFDEWVSTVHCERGVGQFQVSWNSKPLQSQIVVHGTKGSRRADMFLMFNASRKALPLPGPINRVVSAITDNLSPLFQVPLNIVRLLLGRVRQFHGLQSLVETFYERLDAGQPAPVGVESAVSVVEWTERIAQAADADYAEKLQALPVSGEAKILMTGSSGGLGKAVLKMLDGRGDKVRQLVRRLPRDPAEDALYAIGNLGDPEAVDQAVKGAEVVIHVGAATSGGWDQQYGATVVGTQNVIDACLRHGVKRLIHISSLSVIDWASSDGKPVDEATALEPSAELRGAYTRAKLEAEIAVLKPEVTQAMQVLVLRPGQIFGERMPLMNAAVARSIGKRKLMFGDGSQVLPLVHVDDVASAVTLCLDKPELPSGSVFQLVDDTEAWSQNAIVDEMLGPETKVLRLPRGFVLFLGGVSEVVFKLLRRMSPLNRYRLRSAMSRMQFGAENARTQLGWTPEFGVRQGMDQQRDSAGGQ